MQNGSTGVARSLRTLAAAGAAAALLTGAAATSAWADEYRTGNFFGHGMAFDGQSAYDQALNSAQAQAAASGFPTSECLVINQTVSSDGIWPSQVYRSDVHLACHHYP
ncbi:hypothetical protein WEH80_11235 [Actinomycetes bacterium KLBMP 9759]